MFQVAFVHNKKENHNINCKKKKKLYYAQFLEILVNSVCRLKNSDATITLTVYVHSSCCKRIFRMWKKITSQNSKGQSQSCHNIYTIRCCYHTLKSLALAFSCQSQILQVLTSTILHGSLISYCNFQIRTPTRTTSQNL